MTRAPKVVNMISPFGYFSAEVTIKTKPSIPTTRTFCPLKVVLRRTGAPELIMNPDHALVDKVLQNFPFRSDQFLPNADNRVVPGP